MPKNRSRLDSDHQQVFQFNLGNRNQMRFSNRYYDFVTPLDLKVVAHQQNATQTLFSELTIYLFEYPANSSVVSFGNSAQIANNNQFFLDHATSTSCITKFIPFSLKRQNNIAINHSIAI